MKPDIIADVTLFPTSEGGRQGSTPSDHFGCPFMTPNGDRHDARLDLSEHGALALGETVRLPINFLYPDDALPKLEVGLVLQLWELKIIGEAKIIEISDKQTAPEKKGSTAADFSLLLGILSNLCFWFVAGIPAIILGIIALRSINRNPATLTGKDRAWAGIITACTGMLVSPFLLLGSGIWHSHPGSDKPKCILQMSTMEKLVISHGNMNEILPGEPITPRTLVDEGYLPKLYTCPAGGAYIYTGMMPTGKVGSPAYTKCDYEKHDFDPWKSED